MDVFVSFFLLFFFFFFRISDLEERNRLAVYSQYHAIFESEPKNILRILLADLYSASKERGCV